jgi:hypothetical protein
MLSAKYISIMNLSQIAKQLGRRGGLARAKSLSLSRRKAIASLGGQARALSRHAVRRVEENFRYLEAIEALRKATVVHGK